MPPKKPPKCPKKSQTEKEDISTPKSQKPNFAQEGQITAKKLPMTTDSQTTSTTPPESSEVEDVTAIGAHGRIETRSKKVPVVVSSTPAGTSPSSFTERRSPILPILDVSDEVWSTTPLGQSSGVQLLAPPTPIHQLPRKPTIPQLDSCLVNLKDHVEYFGNRFMDNEGWVDQIQSSAHVLSTNIEILNARAAEINASAQLIKTFELRSLLDKYVNDLSDHAKGLINNRPRIVPIIRDSPLSRAVNQNERTVTGDQDNEERPDAEKPKSSELNQRVTALEKSVPTLTSKLTEIKEAMATKSSYEELKLLVNKIGQENRNLTEQIKALQDHGKLMEDKLRGNTLACRQYEQMSCGLTRDYHALKGQFMTLLKRMENLHDQATNLSSATSQQVSTTDPTACQNSVPLLATSEQTSTTEVPSSRPPTNSNENAIPATTVGTQSSQAPQIGNSGQPITTTTQARCSMIHQHPSQDISISSNSDTDSSSYGPDNLSREGRRLQKKSIALKKMLNPAVSKNIPKATLQDIYRNTVVTVDLERKDVSRALDNYERSQGADSTLCDLVEDIIEEATNWTTDMRALHRKLGYHKESLSKKLYQNLNKFSSHSEINIYEFFRRFESYTEEKGSPSERAELLYNEYLDEKVKLEMVNLSHNYEAMKKKLLNKFGDLTIITNNILRTIGKEPPPQHEASYTAQADYYRLLSSLLNKIEELRRSVDVPVDELEDYIYSVDFMNKVLRLVPSNAKDSFMDSMIRSQEDVTKIKGKFAFKMLSIEISNRFIKYDSLARSEDNYDKSHTKKKEHVKRSAQITRKCIETTDDESEDEHVSHASVSHQNSQPTKAVKRHPCILKGHTHDIGECSKFFNMSPQERLKAASYSKAKTCKTCLQNNVNCPKGICSNEKHVPPIMICQDCKMVAQSFQKSPRNILFCTHKNQSKPSNKEIITALQSLLDKFDKKAIQNPIKLAAHLKVINNVRKCHSCKGNFKPISLTSSVDPRKPVPALDTTSGKVKSVKKDKVIPEIEEDCIFVMQILNLKGRDCLTFYDRGANQHLISGQLAEDISLKVVNSEPVIVGVVGGGTIWTEYGSYKLRLGPTQNGMFHEITAQGMRHVTDKFPRYDLSGLTKDVAESINLGPNDKMPKYIGGMRVSLLVSLKEPELEPVCIFNHPSGLAVYKSALKDKFGSHFCYGGPHKLFTSVNKRTGGNVNHINIYFSQVINQYRNSLYPVLTRASTVELADSDGTDKIEKSGMKFAHREETKKFALNTKNPSKIHKCIQDGKDMDVIEVTETLQCSTFTPGDFNDRNRRWKEKRKRRNARLKANRLNNIPKRLYKQLKRTGTLSAYKKDLQDGMDPQTEVCDLAHKNWKSTVPF